MRVIAVDDERGALEALVRELKKTSEITDIYGFAEPQGAIEHSRTHPFDIAFLDIEMFGMTGLSLAKQLKEIQPWCNIVFVTGHAQYALEAFSLQASDFLLKPAGAADIRRALGNLRQPPVQKARSRLQVQTFGNFEVFANGSPLHFSRSKSKELFAYLVHKKGTGVTIKELASALFEDKEFNGSLQRQTQTIISDMMKALGYASARDVIVKRFNSLAIDPSKVDCDYYRFLEWDIAAINAYTGEYMASYSWAEFTIGYLDSRVQ